MSRSVRRSTAVATQGRIGGQRWLPYGDVWLFAVLAVLLAVLACANGTPNSTANVEAPAAKVSAHSSWPPEPQLDMRVPFEPTAFPSAGRTYLTYELYLTNVGTTPITFERLEVLDADATAAKPIAAFEDGQLNTLLQRLGDPILGDVVPEAGDNRGREIAAGRGVVVYLSIGFEAQTSP